MLFVDGFGIGPPDPDVNPFYGGHAPVLERWLARHAVPVDVSMDMAGLPQSATGQTALLTGVNTALAAGGHVQGFPGKVLSDIIRAHNLFDRLAGRGYRSAFANAYYLESVPERLRRRPPSVTTVAALHAFGAVRDGAAMRAHRAVYHDLTRDGLRERGYGGPFLTPEESAADLLGLARLYDFTLFEYFESDRAGHRGTLDEGRVVAGKLDRLAAALEREMDPERDLVLLTSDHGNLEDMSAGLHTMNPVPLVAIGRGAGGLLKAVRRITDIAPALLALYPGG
jgi:hypothetical protein